MICEMIVADAAHHADDRGSCQTPCSTSLIRAFAAGKHLESPAENRFAGTRQSVRTDHEVHIQAANNNDGRLHRVRSMPSFFNSSA